MASAVPSTATCPFRALSIDGGGMRGIYTAAYLGGLATAFASRRQVGPLDIGRGFDLLVGTSTGAIIAAALAATVPMSRVVELYRAHGRHIFRLRMPRKRDLLLDVLRRRSALKAGELSLKAALDEVLGDTTLAEIWNKRRIALCVPAVEMSQHKAYVFKTPHLSATFRRDDNLRLIDVCLATSAAPLYRSLARLEPPPGSPSSAARYFADGGLWANNPVLVALTESLRLLTGYPERPIEIFSLGTCPRPEGNFLDDEKRHMGLPEWKFGANAAALSIDAQETAFDSMAGMLASHLKRECRIVRFPRGRVPAELLPHLELDVTTKDGLDALVEQAAADVDSTLASCTTSQDQASASICRLFDELPPMEQEK